MQGPLATPKIMDGERITATSSKDDSGVQEFIFAISFISVEQAKKNYDDEFKTIRLDQLAAQAKPFGVKLLAVLK